jgi:hypothetical protein
VIFNASRDECPRIFQRWLSPWCPLRSKIDVRIILGEIPARQVLRRQRPLLEIRGGFDFEKLKILGLSQAIPFNIMDA